MKEYDLTHEVQFGVHYKRWVRVMARTQYCGCDVFLYRPFPRSTSIITHWATGTRLAWGKVSPYPSAIVAFLDRELTDENRAKLLAYSGRLVTAHHRAQLCGLPTYRSALPAIRAAREELWSLESTITGQGLPW